LRLLAADPGIAEGQLIAGLAANAEGQSGDGDFAANAAGLNYHDPRSTRHCRWLESASRAKHD
jgi:hypothetical protein